MLLEAVVAGVESAWSPVLAAKVEFINREMYPHFANVVSPTEIVVVSRLHVDLDGKGGEIHITLPYSMLEPLKDTLRAGMQSDRADREELWSQALRNQLEDSNVMLTTRFGTARTTVRTLSTMQPGDIIPFDFDGSATILADGLPLFRGKLADQRGRYAVQITQLNTRKAGSALDAFTRNNQ
jgi:flagellar motor switch protein FliM